MSFRIRLLGALATFLAIMGPVYAYYLAVKSGYVDLVLLAANLEDDDQEDAEHIFNDTWALQHHDNYTEGMLDEAQMDQFDAEHAEHDGADGEHFAAPPQEIHDEHAEGVAHPDSEDEGGIDPGDVKMPEDVAEE
mmetsp:Transcript_35214/g.82221  ORF Transcript_35214/g.82221 Transcript_35214/m.82221 type:complete len:135 (+) Transcript_35214:62-466(+)